jgi:hypothetical protein
MGKRHHLVATLIGYSQGRKCILPDCCIASHTNQLILGCICELQVVESQPQARHRRDIVSKPQFRP